MTDRGQFPLHYNKLSESSQSDFYTKPFDEKVGIFKDFLTKVERRNRTGEPFQDSPMGHLLEFALGIYSDGSVYEYDLDMNTLKEEDRTSFLTVPYDTIVGDTPVEAGTSLLAHLDKHTRFNLMLIMQVIVGPDFVPESYAKVPPREDPFRFRNLVQQSMGLDFIGIVFRSPRYGGIIAFCCDKTNSAYFCWRLEKDGRVTFRDLPDLPLPHPTARVLQVALIDHLGWGGGSTHPLMDFPERFKLFSLFAINSLYERIPLDLCPSPMVGFFTEDMKCQWYSFAWAGAAKSSIKEFIEASFNFEKILRNDVISSVDGPNPYAGFVVAEVCMGQTGPDFVHHPIVHARTHNLLPLTHSPDPGEVHDYIAPIRPRKGHYGIGQWQEVKTDDSSIVLDFLRDISLVDS